MLMPCFEPDELDHILSLPDDDPRREHLNACVRCRSLAKVARGFLDSPEEVPVGTNLDSVRKTLTSALNAEIYGAPARPASDFKDGWFVSWWRVLTLRPALSMAVVVLLVGGGTIAVMKPWVQQQPQLLRGDSGLDPAQGMLDLLPVERIENGRLRLSWESVGEADAYQVQFFASSLTETNRLDPTSETSTVITWSQTSQDAPPGETMLWRVIALRGGDSIALSQVESITRP